MRLFFKDKCGESDGIPPEMYGELALARWLKSLAHGVIIGIIELFRLLIRLNTKYHLQLTRMLEKGTFFSCPRTLNDLTLYIYSSFIYSRGTVQYITFLTEGVAAVCLC